MWRKYFEMQQLSQRTKTAMRSAVYGTSYSEAEYCLKQRSKRDVLRKGSEQAPEVSSLARFKNIIFSHKANIYLEDANLGDLDSVVYYLQLITVIG